jgi:hypothetical protein
MMKIKKELVKRDIAGDTILVPVGKTVYDSNGLFILNELGSFLWDRLEAAENEEELLHAILNEYEVTENVAEKDLRTFLDKLREMGIL